MCDYFEDDFMDENSFEDEYEPVILPLGVTIGPKADSIENLVDAIIQPEIRIIVGGEREEAWEDTAANSGLVNFPDTGTAHDINTFDRAVLAYPHHQYQGQWNEQR